MRGCMAACVAVLQVMAEDLAPSVQTLQRQCSEYNEYQALLSNVDHLRKLLIAFDFVHCNQ